MPMVSMQVDDELMEEFDQLQKNLGYTSRSEALRQSILSFIQKNQSSLPAKEHRVATITVHHEKREDVIDQFIELTQNHEHIIKSINQYNLKEIIVKTMIVAGKTQEINDLFNALNTKSNFKCTINFLIISEQTENKE